VRRKGGEGRDGGRDEMEAERRDGAKLGGGVLAGWMGGWGVWSMVDQGRGKQELVRCAGSRREKATPGVQDQRDGRSNDGSDRVTKVTIASHDSARLLASCESLFLVARAVNLN
jgi:hypothetical protein